MDSLFFQMRTNWHISEATLQGHLKVWPAFSLFTIQLTYWSPMLVKRVVITNNNWLHPKHRRHLPIDFLILSLQLVKWNSKTISPPNPAYLYNYLKGEKTRLLVLKQSVATFPSCWKIGTQPVCRVRNSANSWWAVLLVQAGTELSKDVFFVRIFPLDQVEYVQSQKLLVDVGVDRFTGENWPSTA